MIRDNSLLQSILLIKDRRKKPTVFDKQYNYIENQKR